MENKTTDAELYREKEKRIAHAVSLEKPDRVPILLMSGYLPCSFANITIQEATYNWDKYFKACIDLIKEMDPDMYLNLSSPIKTSGQVNEILGMRQIKWAGHGTKENAPFQFVEKEWMKAEDYDLLLSDPSDYTMRKFLPEIYEQLEALRNLPMLNWFLMGYVTTGLVGLFALPETVKALEKLLEAGKEALAYMAAEQEADKKLMDMGYLPLGGGGGYPAFDYLGTIRGTKGLIMDMYRNPEKVISAMELLTPTIIEAATLPAKLSGNDRIFTVANRGADTLLSIPHFEQFYWPGQKQLIESLIDKGFTTIIHFQGSFDSKLEYYRELPPKKIVGIFDGTDIARAKEVLGDIMCIAGNMPISLLRAGTKEEIEDYTRFLIDTAGKDGGYIMCSNTVLDDADSKRVKCWMDATKKYGIY